MPGSFSCALLLIVSPERAWTKIIARPGWHALACLGVLAAVPSIVAAALALTDPGSLPAAWLHPFAPDSPFATALGEIASVPGAPITPVGERGSAVLAVQLAAAAYAATWLAALSGAAIVYVIAPLFGGQRSAPRSFMLVAYASTPLLLGSLALLTAALAPLIAIAAMHACYVAYLGLPAMTGVARSEAGMCIAIAVVCALVMGQVIGYFAGLLMA